MGSTPQVGNMVYNIRPNINAYKGKCFYHLNWNTTVYLNNSTHLKVENIEMVKTIKTNATIVLLYTVDLDDCKIHKQKVNGTPP